MKENEKFLSDVEEKKNEKINEMSDKFVASFLKENFDGMETDGSVSIELGELCAYLHKAFRCGANMSEV